MSCTSIVTFWSGTRIVPMAAVCGNMIRNVGPCCSMAARSRSVLLISPWYAASIGIVSGPCLVRCSICPNGLRRKPCGLYAWDFIRPVAVGSNKSGCKNGLGERPVISHCFQLPFFFALAMLDAVTVIAPVSNRGRRGKSSDVSFRRRCRYSHR